MGHTKGFHTSNDFDSRPNTRTEQIDTWTRLISLQKPLQNQKTSPLLFFKTNIFSQVTFKPPNIIFSTKNPAFPSLTAATGGMPSCPASHARLGGTAQSGSHEAAGDWRQPTQGGSVGRFGSLVGEMYFVTREDGKSMQEEGHVFSCLCISCTEIQGFGRFTLFNAWFDTLTWPFFGVNFDIPKQRTRGIPMTFPFVWAWITGDVSGSPKSFPRRRH